MARLANAATSDAKRLLTDTSTSAVALLPAAKSVVGDFLAWEPDTVWVELSRVGIEVPEICRDKIMAAWTLLLVPSFYWDGVIFEKTALAFDGVVINPEILEEATSAQLAWAVREAEWVRSRHDDAVPEFAHEPRAYAAVVLRREGLVIAPPQLSFVQETLNEMKPGDPGLRRAVEARLAEAPEAFTESAEDIQLARLAAIALHVKEREARAAADLAALATVH